MALTDTQMIDLAQYKDVSLHIENILAKESGIATANRLLTAANITALNTLYTEVIERITEIINPAP